MGMCTQGDLRVGAAVTMALAAVTACTDASDAPGAEQQPQTAAPEPATGALVLDGTGEMPEDEAARASRARMVDEEFPLHGLVTGLQLTVRKEPDPEADPVGWLRVGARLRLSRERTRTSNCNTGWYRIHPLGWACAGQGIEVGDAPPDSELAVPPPARDAALPYPYWFVKEPMVPEYHQLPSRDAQRAATAFAERYLEMLRADQERRAERLLAGELPNEPGKPAAIHRFLDRGYYVAGSGTEVRASRRFVRTVRGRYVKQSRVIERAGSDFAGVELGDVRDLPVAWVVRNALPMIKRERADGTIRFVDDREAEPFERHETLDSWVERRNIGGRNMHVLEGERYLHDWFVAVAESIERPRGIADDEPWVHVRLGRQTLVLYEGDTPVFATLVSSGEAPHTTPTGVFTIRRKYIADTMANIGAGQDDRYSIEDVPWTQYFEGSFALHGAFWHERFGLTRSHGCVNLSPRDAHRIFDRLWPHVPEGWLGVSTDRTGFRTSHVVITE